MGNRAQFVWLGDDHAGVRPGRRRVADRAAGRSLPDDASSSCWACCWCHWPWAPARWVHDLWALGALRFLTGLALGMTLPNLTALVAELAPAKIRSGLLTLISLGISFGALGSGLVVPKLLPAFGWQGAFLCSSAAGLVFLALLFFLLPEAPSFLSRDTLPRRLPRARRASHSGTTPRCWRRNTDSAHWRCGFSGCTTPSCSTSCRAGCPRYCQVRLGCGRRGRACVWCVGPGAGTGRRRARHGRAHAENQRCLRGLRVRHRIAGMAGHFQLELEHRLRAHRRGCGRHECRAQRRVRDAVSLADTFNWHRQRRGRRSAGCHQWTSGERLAHRPGNVGTRCADGAGPAVAIYICASRGCRSGARRALLKARRNNAACCLRGGAGRCR